MADIAPAPAVGLDHLHRIAEEFAILGKPESAEISAGEKPLPPLVVGGEFEAGQDILPQGGGDDLLDLAAEQSDLELRIALDGKEMTGKEHLGKDAGGFGEREGGIVVVEILPGGEGKVDAVSELVRQGRKVAQGAGIIRQNIGRDPRCHAVTEGAATLPRRREDVDPLFGEKRLCQGRQLRREGGEGGKDRRPGFGKIDMAHLRAQGGIQVGILHPFQAEELTLEDKILLAKTVIRFADRHHPLDHGRLGLALQMGRRHQLRVAAQLRLLAVIKEDVVEAGDQHRRGGGVTMKKSGKSRLADRSVGMVKEGEELFAARFAGSLFAGEGEGEAHLPGDLLEELGKGLLPREIFTFEGLLDRLAQGVGGVGAQLLQVVPVLLQFRRRQEGSKGLAAQAQQVEFEKKGGFHQRVPDLAGPGKEGLVAVVVALGTEKKLGVKVRLQPRLL